MKFVFENANKIRNEIVNGSVIDLSRVSFLDPWTVILLCLMLVERHNFPDKAVILPTDNDLLRYLKRMHLDALLRDLGYREEAVELEQIVVPERNNLKIQEIIHCRDAGEFGGRLGRFISIFEHFGLSKDDATRVATLVGELGNNTFDHNFGSWPTDFMGCVITAQSYPRIGRIQVVVGDAGVGFLNSLRAAYPELKDDISAIKKGLAGFTGRIGEIRGNGLRLIQDWTINNFSGKLSIQSGEGIVEVDKDGMTPDKANFITGTIAQLLIHYNPPN